MIEVTDGAEPREQRIALSMKLVNQADGADLDPSNAEAETDVGGAFLPFMMSLLRGLCTFTMYDTSVFFFLVYRLRLIV